MTRLFGRKYKMIVSGLKNDGTIQTVTTFRGPVLDGRTGLSISFKIKHSLKRDGNKAEFKLYNLNETHRAEFQTNKDVKVTFEAGYSENIDQIFKGDIITSIPSKEGVDFITTMQAGDGQNQLRRSKISESWKKGTPLDKVLKTMAKKMGVGLGNAFEKISQGDIRGSLTELASGFSVAGTTADEMTKMARSMGYEWSIQGGQLQFLEIGKDLGNTAIVLNAASGMIGSPEPGKKGIVNVKSLLQGKLIPGKKVLIESVGINGLYRIQTVEHSGDSKGGDWFSQIEGKPTK